MSQGPEKRRGLLPPNLDADRFIKFVLDEVDRAAKSWKEGDPPDEIAFMSHLIGRLKKRRRKCDVGRLSPMAATSETYVLHRQGDAAKDKYGADLAVTLDIGPRWRKTVIFQLKKSKGYKVLLNKDDLKGAHEDPLIAERSFVLAIDEERLGIRLSKVDRLEADLRSNGTATKTFDTNSWTYLNDWLQRWLRCELAPRTAVDGSPGVEGLLEAFRKEPIEVDEEYPFVSTDARHLDHVPARVWLQTDISRKTND